MTRAGTLKRARYGLGPAGLPCPLPGELSCEAASLSSTPAPESHRNPEKPAPCGRREALVWRGVGLGAGGLGDEAGGPGLHNQGLFLKEKLTLQTSPTTSVPTPRASVQPGSWALLLCGQGTFVIIPPYEVVTPTPTGQRKTSCSERVGNSPETHSG